VPQAEAIHRNLKKVYPHQALFPGSFEGKGVISRYPIRSAEQLYLYPSRPDLNVVIDMDGVRLGMVVAHPPPPQFGLRGFFFDLHAKTQISALIQKTIASPPAVLLGDFNTWEKTLTYAELLQSGLKDAFRKVGAGAGYTLPLRLGSWKRLQGINWIFRWMPLRPFLRVDYIWHTNAITALAAWLGEDAGSDHLPVLARLAIDVDSDLL
jgi:endonuclease/exonuclease/phosphatase family metal-dependent hydrolase